MISYSHIVTTVSGETLRVISLSYQSLPSLSSPEEVSLWSLMLFSGSLFSARDKKERFVLLP